MKVRVLVSPKQGILDPQGIAVRGSLEHLGFSVSDVRVGRLVDLDIDAADESQARQMAEAMCDKLLANSLIESYELQVRDDA